MNDAFLSAFMHMLRQDNVVYFDDWLYLRKLHSVRGKAIHTPNSRNPGFPRYFRELD